MRRDVTVSPVGCGDRYGVVYSEALPVLGALNIPRAVWLNTITDTPFHTEKINFLRKINEKSSISGPVRASQRGAVLSVRQFTSGGG